MEKASGRTISTQSNVETRYSTEGQAFLVIHDRPFSDPSRTVSLNSTTQTENTDAWFIQDRRHTEITTTIQLQAFLGGDSYKRDPMWWDKNLDTLYRKWGEGGFPNDLVITGIIGHPTITEDTKQAWIAMTAHLFRQKDQVGEVTFSPQGVPIDISELPSQVQLWIQNWRIRTAVAAVG